MDNLGLENKKKRIQTVIGMEDPINAVNIFKNKTIKVNYNKTKVETVINHLELPTKLLS